MARRPRDPAKTKKYNDARRLRVLESSRQNESVRPFTDRYSGDAETYLNANKARVLAERAKQIANGVPRNQRGHAMNWAQGALKSGFTKTLNRAMSGGRVKKELKRQKGLGKKSNVAKVRKGIKSQHVVKFGQDPYHS